MNQRDQITIASLNMHAGRGCDGEPYDVAGACHQLKADVIMLQEVWRPAGQPDPVTAAAEQLGATVMHIGLASTDLATLGIADSAAPGSWGLAVLTMLPVTGYQMIALGAAPTDWVHRAAQVLTVVIPGGQEIRLVNTHLTHRLTSPVQLRRLTRRLVSTGTPTLIAGDLNMPRAGTLAALSYRPVVRGRTYPADRPLIQLDHLLAGQRVTACGGEVLDGAGSDHLPVRAQVSVAE